MSAGTPGKGPDAGLVFLIRAERALERDGPELRSAARLSDEVRALLAAAPPAEKFPDLYLADRLRELIGEWSRRETWPDRMRLAPAIRGALEGLHAAYGGDRSARAQVHAARITGAR